MTTPLWKRSLRKLLRGTGFIFQCTILIVSAYPAHPQDSQLHIDASDSPLVITGRLDGENRSFGGSVRLMYTGGTTAKLVFLPSDLRDRDRVINRADIVMEGSAELSSHQPVDVRITLKNVAYPGTYAGTFHFMLVGQPERLTLPVEARIGVVPKVVLVTDTLSIQAVRCASVSCWFASLLLPENTQRDRWPIALENRALLDARVTGATIVVSSTAGFVGNKIRLADPITIPPHDVRQAELIVERDRLAPSTYSGSVRFRVEGSDDPVILPLQLFVRSGPLIPLLAILLGILVGRMARGLETPQAQAQLRLVRLLNQLEQDASAVTIPEAMRYVQMQIANLRERNNRMEDEQTLRQAIQELGQRIAGLLKLEEIETTMKSADWKDSALSQQVLKAIPGARAKWFEPSKSISEAKAANEDIQRMIETAIDEERVRGSEGPELQAAEQLLLPNTVPSVEMAGQVQPASRRSWQDTIRRTLATVSGIPANAEVRYYVVRPLLWLLALVFLALMGLQNQYINTGASFGASGIYDFLGLFLWGVSADIATTSILRLPETLGQK